MTASSNDTLRGKSIMPSLTVDNLQKSLDFFVGLGFIVEDRWEENGVLLGAMLKAGETRLGLSQDDGKKGTNRVKGVGMRLYIEADGNIDDLAAQAKQAGIALTTEPNDTEWGSRAFDVTEPSGFVPHHRITADHAGEVEAHGIRDQGSAANKFPAPAGSLIPDPRSPIPDP